MIQGFSDKWVDICVSNSQFSEDDMLSFMDEVTEDMPPTLREKYGSKEEAAIAFYENYKNSKGTCTAPRDDSMMCQCSPEDTFGPRRKRRVPTYMTEDNIEGILSKFDGYWKPAIRKALTLETRIYDQDAIDLWLEEVTKNDKTAKPDINVVIPSYTGHRYKKSNTMIDLHCNVIKSNVLISASMSDGVVDLSAFTLVKEKPEVDYFNITSKEEKEECVNPLQELKSISNDGYQSLDGAEKLILPNSIVDLDPTQLRCIRGLKEIESYDYRHTSELLYSIGSSVTLNIKRTFETRQANLEEALGLIGKLPKRKEDSWNRTIHDIIDSYCEKEIGLHQAVEETRATNFCPDSVLIEDLENAFNSYETHDNYYKRAEIIRLLIDVPDNPDLWKDFKCYSTIPLSESTEEIRQKTAYSYSAMLKERGDMSHWLTACVAENMGSSKGYIPVDPNTVKPKVVGFEMELGYVDLTDIPLGIWNRTLTGENVTIEINNKGVAKIKAKRSVKTASIADMNRPLGITVRVPCDTTEKVMYTNYSEKLVRLNLKAAFDRPAYAVKDEYSKIFKRPV